MQVVARRVAVPLAAQVEHIAEPFLEAAVCADTVVAVYGFLNHFLPPDELSSTKAYKTHECECGSIRSVKHVARTFGTEQ